MVFHRNFQPDGVMTGRVRRHLGETRGLAGPRAEKSVSLALQGGGAHGAFTWGVLDALLEDGAWPSRRSPVPAPAP
jgi:predicted acylesterase/phospholipase RssA